MRIPALLSTRGARIAVAVAAVGVLVSACLPFASTGTETGPVMVDVGARGKRPIDFPDPFITRFGNTYYGYSTSSNGAEVQVIKSPDAVNWSWVGDAFVGPSPYFGATSAGSGWAILNGNTWAPGIIERPANPPESRYVLYYTAKSKVPESAGRPCIGRGVSATPEGPFIDESATPIVCAADRGGSIDPNPIVADGQVYLLWQNYGIAPTEPTRLWNTPLTADGLAPAAPARQLTEVLYGSQEWPNIEGPTMMPAPGGGYLLFYSAGMWWNDGYRNYAQWCATPLGECNRIYSTSVLSTRGAMVGPGGPTVFQDPAGDWIMGFHVWTAPYVGYDIVGDIRYARSLRLLPITFPQGGHSPKIG